MAEVSTLALDDDGDLAVPLRYITGREAIAQSLRVRLAMFRGEWFADLDFGLPYFQEILGKKFVAPRIVAAFRDLIIATPGVAEIADLTATFSSRTRTLTVRWQVRTIYGLVVGATEF